MKTKRMKDEDEYEDSPGADADSDEHEDSSGSSSAPTYVTTGHRLRVKYRPRVPFPLHWFHDRPRKQKAMKK